MNMIWLIYLFAKKKFILWVSNRTADSFCLLAASAPAPVQLGCQLAAVTVRVFWSIHHWIDQQKLMALKFLMKSWKIFWFRLYSGHFKQFGKNNLCLLNYFMEKIAVLRRKSGKSETYTSYPNLRAILSYTTNYTLGNDPDYWPFLDFMRNLTSFLRRCNEGPKPIPCRVNIWLFRIFLSSLGNAALNQNKYDFKLLIKIRIVYDEILII